MQGKMRGLMNPLATWIHMNEFSYSDVRRKINVSECTLWRWAYNHSRPTRKNAVRLQKISKGDIPITYWGYCFLNKGKIADIGKPQWLEDDYVSKTTTNDSF